MKRRVLKPYYKVLQQLGFEVIGARDTGGCHIKIEVTVEGKKRFLIVPASPSDRRGFLNWKSDAKRLRREL